MDWAGVPLDSELRRVENIFFPEDIREIPDSDTPTKKLPSAYMTLPDINTLGKEGVDKKAQQPVKDKPSEDFLMIRDVVSQAKEAELKSRAEGACSEATDPKKNTAKDKV